MTSGQKTALSLLISVILFAAFAVAAFAGLFSAIDARFYESAKISQIDKKLDGIAQAFDGYLETLAERFALGQGAFLKNPSVKSFVEAKSADQDVLSRAEALGGLRSSTQGFLGLRVLDKNQNSIHYSTFHSDILRRDEKSNLTAYKNYLDCQTASGESEIPAQIVSCSDSGGDLEAGKKIYFDKESRIVFSFPLYDKYSVFRGSAVFYVNALDFANVLLKKNLISIGQDMVFLSNGLEGAENRSGYVFGMPSVAREDFEQALFDAWKVDSGAAERLLSLGAQSKNFWVAVSKKAKAGVFACGIYNDEIFAMSQSERVLILVCVFVSIFLICFLILNLRRDDETVIRERIKTLQLGVVDEYLSKKEALNWETISGRRDAVTKEIIQSLGSRAKKRRPQVEELINRSWDELFAAMNLKPSEGSANGGLGPEGAQEIKAMLQELLSSGSLKVQAVQAPSEAKAVGKPESKAAMAPAEPVEDLEEAEPVEVLEEAEPVEDVEEAEPVEDLEEAEPVEDLEEAEPVEDLEEAEPVEDLEEAEPVEDLEDAEPVEDLEEAEPVEDLEEAEPVEDLEEAEPVEDLEEAEPVEDLEEAEPVEDLEEAEPVEDLEEAEPVEDLEEAEPVEDLAEAEPVEDLEEAEPVEGAELPHEDHKEIESLAATLSSKDEGDVDTSEKVSEDFFALRSKDDFSEAPSIVGDKELNPYSGVRDFFAPNKETEDVVKNFSIYQPDFTDLDARNDEEKVNGTLEEERSEYYKELSPEDFGVEEKKEKEEFSEPLEFGAPENKGLDDGTDVASTFTTESPSFDSNRSIYSPEQGKASEPLAPIGNDSEGEASAIPLEGEDSFMFSSFGQDAAALELQAADYSAIVQDSNGVFSIVDDIKTGGVVQDNSFKRLVDSVLNNS